MTNALHRLTSAFVATTAALGAAACSSTESNPDPSEKLAEIVEVRNAQGQSTIATIVYTEWLEEFVDKRASGKGYTGKQLETALHEPMSAHLKKKGFTDAEAKKAATNIIEGYRAYIHARIHMPATVMSDTMQSVFTGAPTVSTECTVTQLASVYDTQEWVRDFVDMHDDKRRLIIPYDFKDEIFQFLRNHEIAHCMGADEPQADKTAAKFMLKDHPDKAKALAFLELMKAIRSIDPFQQQMSPNYYGTFLAIDSVIKDFKKKKTVTQSAEEIWSEALERPYYGGEHVRDLTTLFRPRREIVARRDFKNMAEHLHKEVIAMEHGPRRNVAVTMVEGLRHLGKIVEDKPSP